MKKVILSLVAFMAFGFANAQDKDGMKFGVKIGFASVNLTAKSSFMGASTSITASETDVFVGGLVDLPIAGKFHVQPELNYVMIKDYNQLQIPILAKYYATDDLHILVGPNLGFAVTNKYSEVYKSFNYGVDFGAGYDITENIVVDLRYNFGLANLMKDGDADNSIKMSAFYIGAAYKF